MNPFKTHLEARLEELENLAQQGVIPGQLDSIELEQIIGRIKELKYILKLLKLLKLLEDENNERL